MAQLEATKKEDPTVKTLVFSQFTKMLDQIQIPLTRQGYKFLRYDGKLTIEERDECVKKFCEGSTATVLLMSLKCGSLGLNLTAASRVILVDIWWNPFLEEQAIDRVHRMGQTKSVKVVRLTITKTIEDRILLLQEQKRSLAMAALAEGDWKKFAKQRLSVKDLCKLFNV